MPAQQKFPEGVRPGSKGGIEIRWNVAGKPYSRYIPEAPTPTALKRASKLRLELIATQKAANATADSGVKLFADVVKEYLRKSDLASTTPNRRG